MALMPTKEEENFLRIVYLNYRVGTTALRRYFDSVHPNLQSDLSSPSNKAILSDLHKPHRRRRKVLYQDQWNMLYPSPVSHIVSSADLDVTLMVCLLRNLPPYVSPPTTGFDALPQSNDLSHGAHIARIKYYKNFIVAHSKDGKLSDTDFKRIWIDLEMAIHGLGNQQDVKEAADAKSKFLDYNALKEIVNVGFSIHRTRKRLNDQCNELAVHSSKIIKLESTVKNMEKGCFKSSQIKDKEEEPKALQQSEHSGFDSDDNICTTARKVDMKKRHPKMTEKDNLLQEVSTFEKTEYIKNGFLDCKIDQRLHALNKSTMDNFKNLKKNLLIKCNNYIVNCDVDRRLHTKFIHSDFPLKKDISWNDLKDFEKLIYTSFHVDRKSLSSKFWILNFFPEIQNQDSNLCRFLLTIVDKMGNDRWKTCFHHLLAGLSISMRIRDTDTSKVIAWFITKKCFQSLKRPIQENIIDIWPGFLCTCQRQKEVFCIDENETKYVKITININALSPDLPLNFWNINITYMTNTTVNNAEGSQILEHLQSSSGNIHMPDKRSISGVDAKQLFNEHSNLSLIHKSPFKSTGFQKQKQKVIAQSCYQLYCKRKGIIPIGEKHFPTTLNGLQTDVVEGIPHFLSNLKVGNQVGTDEFKRGTLGGFVQVRGDKAFLTCLHVFLSAEELASENLSLDDEKTVPVKLYRENDNSHICGKIREIAFEVDNEKETSIDAALVEIPADSIDNFDYVDIGNEKLSYKDIGMKSEYLNNSCVDYRPLCFSKPQPILQTVCVGAVSGFRNTTEPMVYENTDKSIDLETIEETYSKAILDEIKTNVKVVIQSLKQIPIAVSLDDYTIKMNIAQNCDSNISSEIKDIIIAVMRNIYSTMQCTNDVDIDRLIHEHIFCKTQSNFSAIIGDVHMQHAFLKKTGKNMAIKRTSRRVYNQIYISNIPFQPGDSGTCIYVLSPVQGCIGMAIADHPLGGCIVTPIMDILKHFKIRIK